MTQTNDTHPESPIASSPSSRHPNNQNTRQINNSGGQCYLEGPHPTTGFLAWLFEFVVLGNKISDRADHMLQLCLATYMKQRRTCDRLQDRTSEEHTLPKNEQQSPTHGLCNGVKTTRRDKQRASHTVQTKNSGPTTAKNSGQSTTPGVP